MTEPNAPREVLSEIAERLRRQISEQMIAQRLREALETPAPAAEPPLTRTQMTPVPGGEAPGLAGRIGRAVESLYGGMIPGPGGVETPIGSPGMETAAIPVTRPDPIGTQLRDERSRRKIDIVEGEAPFMPQLGAAFGMPESEPLRQMLQKRGFETTQVESEGPLKGQLLFRRRGSSDPWTTAQNPRITTPASFGTTAVGAAPGVVIPTALAFAAPPTWPIQAAAGLAGGGVSELVRQQIGRKVFGLEPGRPGEAPAGAATTSGEQAALAREALIAGISPIVGKVVIGTLNRILGTGAIPGMDPAKFRGALREIEAELTSILGPEEAKRAMAQLSAADVAASLREGALLEAQLQRTRASGTGGGLRELEQRREQYITDLGNRLLGGRANAPEPGTRIGEMVESRIPQPLSDGMPGMPAAQRAEQAALEAQQGQLGEAGLVGLQGLTEGGAAQIPGGALGATIRRAAPRGEEAVQGRVVNPEQEQAGREIREALERARAAALRTPGDRIEEVVRTYGAEAVPPTATSQVAAEYQQRLAARAFPSVSPESQPLVNNFFQRAFDGEGNLLPRTLQQLREDSSNLKEVIRQSYLGKYSGDIEMLNDFVTAIDDDILRLLRTRGGPAAAYEYRAAIEGYREAMDLFSRSGQLEKLRSLRPGGAEAVGDASVAATIFRNADQSRAVSEAIDGLANSPRAHTKETIRATLRWELLRRAAPQTGEDVSPGALANAIRDNEQILAPWFSRAELDQISSRAADIANVRRAMGVDRNQDVGRWFDDVFWKATPTDARTILDRVRRLPATEGPDGRQATLETLRALTKQKIYNEYTSFKGGVETFNADKFFNDMLRNPSRQQFYNEVMGPSWAARSRSVAEILSTQARNLNERILAARATSTTDAAAKEADDIVAKSFAGMSRAMRDLYRAPAGFNKTTWMDDRWNDMDVDNIRRLVADAGANSDLVKAMQTKTLNIIWKQITARRPSIMKAEPTAKPFSAIDENELLKIVTDPDRVEWMGALFGGKQNAGKQLSDLVTVVGLLRPDQARAILTAKTDPALLSIEQLRRIRNVVLGPLNPKSRVTTRMLEWSSDRIKQRAADALIDPQAFLRLQEAAQRTRAGIAGQALIAQPFVRYILPNDIIGMADSVSDKFQERISR